MKVSDLILELQEFYEEHGELEVMLRVEPSFSPSVSVSKGTVISSAPFDEEICVISG